MEVQPQVVLWMLVLQMEQVADAHTFWPCLQLRPAQREVSSPCKHFGTGHVLCR